MTCEEHPISFRFDAHIYSEGMDEFEDRPDNRNLQPEIEILRREENTWGLLQALMSSVSIHSFSSINICLIPPKTEPEKPTHHPPNPPKNSSKPLYTHLHIHTSHHGILTRPHQLIVVREWPQETAPMPSPPEANTGYWKFTKHTIMQSYALDIPNVMVWLRRWTPMR